tara:strand:- start:2355 stop:3326 length:972 start_codon:yes stop_codon:yes gene_type:complete
MNYKPILIICGEPNSVFSEILIKSLKIYKSKKPIILIGSSKLLNAQFMKLGLRLKLNELNLKKNHLNNIEKDKINILNIKYNFKKPFEKISLKSKKYISDCFNEAFKVIKYNKISGLINGPISKEFFLKGRYKGITEYISFKFNIKNKFAMLIYNKSLSVSPITTHLPINRVSKEITTNDIVSKTILISNFFKKNFNKKPKLGITGLNPHCENFSKMNEEINIIKPAIKILKKKRINISGPFPADTIFLTQNCRKFDVIIGMYHDQVLAPIKAIKGFDAINITLGLPFIRISPDHGPNYRMVGKNKSNPQSLVEAIKFLDRPK